MSWLYAITIYPLKTIYLAIYTLLVILTGNYAASLFLLSFVSVLGCIPLERLAFSFQADEQKIQSVMRPQIERITSESSGAERQRRISALYHRYAYNPLYSIRSAAGIAVQIPLLIGAYYMLSELPELSGQDFFGLFSLGAPDALLGGINLLPLLMTVLNLLTAYIAPDLSRRDRIQAAAIAVLFLVMLYDAPSALMVYWTTNNAVHLFRAFLKRRGISLVPAMIKEKLANVFGSVHFLAALVFSVELLIFAPMVSYFGNVNEFSYDPETLLNSLLPLWAKLFLLMLAGFFLASWIKKLAVQGKDEKVSYLELVGAACAICVLLEGTILGYGLPQLDGKPNLFSSTPRLIADSLVWLGLISVFIGKRNKIAVNFRSILYAIAVCMIVLGITEYGNREPVYNKSDVVGENGLRRYNGDNILGSIKYHPTDNVIILLLDTMDTLTLEKALEIHPEYKKTLENFTLYRNNLWVGGQTAIAIPQILTGKLYDGIEYKNLLHNAVMGEESIAGTAVIKNRYFYMISNIAALNVSNGEIAPFKKNINLKTIHIFKFLPYLLKHYWEPKVNFLFSESISLNDKEIFDVLRKNTIKFSSRPSTLFVHMVGAHPPYRWDIDGNKISPEYTYKAKLAATGGLLKWIDLYINDLKKSKLYNASTIFIIADHGDNYNYKDSVFDNKVITRSSLLMAKFAYEKHPLLIRNEPTSSHDICNLVNLSYGNNIDLKERIEQYISSLRDIREYYSQNDDTIRTMKGIDRDNLIEIGKRERSENMDSMTQLQPDIVYTFQSSNVNLPQANPIGKGFSKFGGNGIDINGQVQFALQFNKLLKNKSVDVDIAVTPSSSKGENYENFHVTIEDMTSHVVSRYEIEGSMGRILSFNDAILDEEGKLHLKIYHDGKNTYPAFLTVVYHSK